MSLQRIHLPCCAAWATVARTAPASEFFPRMERPPVRAKRHQLFTLTSVKQLFLAVCASLAAFFFFAQLVGLFNVLWPGKERGQFQNIFFPVKSKQTSYAGDHPFSGVFNKTNRTAVCLVGELRDFELSGPTIRKHLLPAFENADVFAITPLDDNTHKLTLLFGSANFAKIHVLPERPLQVKDASQALLKYFNLVENCLRLIKSYEQEQEFEYSYIFRTQLDGFWTGPPPPLPANVSTYVVPLGSSFSGINDRLGVGGRKVSQFALARLTMLPELRLHALSGLNPETAFAAHLQLKPVSVIRTRFPFCIISRRKYKWPPDLWGVPILAISNKVPMNGAKCRPCRPVARREDAEAILRQFERQWGWPGASSGLDLCNSSLSWEGDAEAIFSDTVGLELARQSKGVVVRSMEGCVGSYKQVEARAGYDGPSARIVCQLAQWGPFKTLGSVQRGQDWPLYLQPLSKNSVVYSFGLEPGLSWEREIVKAVGSKVYVFDGTPMARPWVKTNWTSTEHGIVAHEWNLGPKDGLMVFHPLTLGVGALKTYTTLEAPFEGYSVISEGLSLPTKCLSTIMEELGHTLVDLVKLDVDGTEFSVVFDDWSKMKAKLPVCQLLVRFGTNLVGSPTGEVVQFKALEALKHLGFVVIHCSGSFDSEKCLLLRDDDLCK